MVRTLGALNRGERFKSGQGSICEVVRHVSYYSIIVKEVGTEEELEMDPRGKVEQCLPV